MAYDCHAEPGFLSSFKVRKAVFLLEPVFLHTEQRMARRQELYIPDLYGLDSGLLIDAVFVRLVALLFNFEQIFEIRMLFCYVDWK